MHTVDLVMIREESGVLCRGNRSTFDDFALIRAAFTRRAHAASDWIADCETLAGLCDALESSEFDNYATSELRYRSTEIVRDIALCFANSQPLDVAFNLGQLGIMLRGVVVDPLPVFRSWKWELDGSEVYFASVVEHMLWALEEMCQTLMCLSR